jgi:hypothetical protein
MTNSKIIKPLGNGKRKILSLDEAMAQIDAHQPPKPQGPEKVKQVETLNGIYLVDPNGVQKYQNVKWEPKVEVSSLEYDHNENRLRQDGWDRAPSPQELFSLLAAYYEGKFHDNTPFRRLAESILASNGLFTCHFCSIEESQASTRLRVLEYVSDIEWDSQKGYSFLGSAHHKRVLSFDITGLERQTAYCLETVNIINPNLIAYFFTREYKDLPEQLQNLKMRLDLFEDRRIGSLVFSPKSNIIFACMFNNADSLGVKEK